MRVLHVIPSVSMVHGGPSHAVRTMERELHLRGLSVTTLTTDDDGPGRHASKAATDAGPHRVALRKQTEFYKMSLPMVPWLQRHVRDFDLVHVHALFSFSSTVAGWQAHRAAVPFVVRPLGVLSPYGLNGRRAVWKRVSLEWCERPLLRRAAAVHCTSQQEAREVLDVCPDARTVVIPLGLDFDSLESSERGGHSSRGGGPQRLLFMSRLDPKKGVELLFAAFAQVMHDFPTAELVVAGAGSPDYEAHLRHLATELGIGHCVQWVGHVGGERKRELLAASTLFVLPSHNENFGIAVLEAMAAGLPCVVTEGVALGEELRAAAAGLQVPRSVEAVADALALLLRNPEEAEAMGRRAAALAREQFSVEAMGGKLVRLYEDVTQ